VSIASNFRDKWDVLIKASDDTFHSFVPDTRRAAMARAADAADLILTERRAFQALANRIRELEDALSAERARVIAQIEALVKDKWQAAYDNMERAVSNEFKTALDMRQAAIANILDDIRALGQGGSNA
jgi:hypothetical protein